MADRETFASESIQLLATFNGHRLIAYTPIRVRCVDCGCTCSKYCDLPNPCEGPARIERLERVEANARAMLGRVAEALDIVLDEQARPGRESIDLPERLTETEREALLVVIRDALPRIRAANGGAP